MLIIKGIENIHLIINEHLEKVLKALNINPIKILPY